MAREDYGKSLFVCGCFAPVFVVLRFCNSLNCVVCGRFSKIAFCNSQCRASRSLPTRRLAASAVAGLAAPQAAFASFRKSVRCKFASFASVGAVLFSGRSQRGEYLRASAGRGFGSPG